MECDPQLIATIIKQFVEFTTHFRRFFYSVSFSNNNCLVGRKIKIIEDDYNQMFQGFAYKMC